MSKYVFLALQRLSNVFIMFCKLLNEILSQLYFIVKIGGTEITCDMMPLFAFNMLYVNGI